MERDKIFIATKGRVGDGDDAEAVISKVRACLDRLKTDYVDSFSMHAVPSVEALSHPGYHAAMDQLKAEGRVRFKGVSYHGRERPGMSLSAAAEDGRFDMMLLVYNFMNHDDGDRIIAACKANNVGTTAMKTSPGSLEYATGGSRRISRRSRSSTSRGSSSRGQSREQAIGRLQTQAERQKATYDQTRPFAEQYRDPNPGPAPAGQHPLGSPESGYAHRLCVALPSSTWWTRWCLSREPVCPLSRSRCCIKSALPWTTSTAGTAAQNAIPPVLIRCP